MAPRSSASSFEGAPPKRTRIGHGRRIRNAQGRTKRSPLRKLYRGQGR